MSTTCISTLILVWLLFQLHSDFIISSLYRPLYLPGWPIDDGLAPPPCISSLSGMTKHDRHRTSGAALIRERGPFWGSDRPPVAPQLLSVSALENIQLINTETGRINEWNAVDRPHGHCESLGDYPSGRPNENITWRNYWPRLKVWLSLRGDNWGFVDEAMIA